MLPPFSYRGRDGNGVFARYAEAIERVADPRRRSNRYHILQVSQVPISLPLTERLPYAYAGVIAGVKDSSASWSNMRAILECFQLQGFPAFAASKTYLRATMCTGGITATGNVNPRDRAFNPNLAAGPRRWPAGVAGHVAGIVYELPMTAALKAALAHCSGDARFAAIRPPSVRFDAVQNADLLAVSHAKDFSMPGP